MPLHSSLYSYPADAMPWAVDEDGAPIPGTLAVGLIQVTAPDLPLPPDERHAYARHVFHVEPGREPPPGWSACVVDGRLTPWTPEQMVAVRPEESRYLMEAEWEEPEGLVRGKEVAVPDGVTPRTAGLLPNLWLGEDPTPAPEGVI